MQFPKWTPVALIECIADSQKFLNEECGTDFENSIPQHVLYRDTVTLRLQIVERLATRPEMEEIWKYLFSMEEYSEFLSEDGLRKVGGLIAQIFRWLENFGSSLKITTKEYEEELLEISRLAEKLSIKLKKFCELNHLSNPFPSNVVFDRFQIENIARIIDPRFFSTIKYPPDFNAELRDEWRIRETRSRTAYLLNDCLPNLDMQLHNLSVRATKEKENKASRHNDLPRKIKGENAFRTYFIGNANKFFLMLGNYSITRVATFCSVALDDADITADLVRGLFPMDEETKKFVKFNIIEVNIDQNS